MVLSPSLFSRRRRGFFCNSAIAAAAGREASAKQIGKAMFPLTWIKVSTAFLCSHKLQKTIGGLP
jgi:hypothetical protein